MINKFFAFLVFGVLIFNSAGAAFAGAGDKKPARGQTKNALAARLPASELAIAFDARRFFDTALPQVLAKNQPLLAEITGHLDEIKTDLGFDLRQFEQIAIGASVKKLTGDDYDVAPVILARGSEVNAGGLVSAIKLIGDKNIREEKIAGKSVLTINTGDTKLGKKRPAVKAGKTDDAMERALDRMIDQISVTAFDANTIAIGTPERVRQILTSKIHLAPDVSALLNRHPTAILSFAAKIPVGLSKLLPLDDDELGKNIDAIRYLSGSADITTEGAKVQLSAKTLTAAQAKSLLDTVSGLQMLGKAILGDTKSEEKQIYGRMIDNAKLARKLNEITLDLQVPQADIDFLVREKNKTEGIPGIPNVVPPTGE